jgi:hypothetical protein
MSELRELVELREEVTSFAVAEARAGFRDAAGFPLEANNTLAERLRAHPLVANRDGLSQAQEMLLEAQASDPPRPGRVSRLSGLRDRLVHARAQSLEPGSFRELSEGALRPSVELHGDQGLHGLQPIRAVERELGRGRGRGERADMEAALAMAEAQLDGARTAAFDASLEALGELDAGEPEAAAAQLHARGWALDGDTKRFAGPTEIAAACEKLLAKTDALAQDLGGWLLERHTGARPFPGDAERHDLLHLIRAPRCSPAFPRGEMLRTCRRWSEAWRLDLNAGKAIKLDASSDDERPLAREGAQAFAIDPPDEARIQLFSEEGPWALGELLSALGAAQLFVAPPGSAPPEDLHLYEAALPIASGALFSGLLRDDEFRRRCAKVELPIDDARSLAVAHLFELRIAAARTLASLEALRSGLGGKASQAHRELFARAAISSLPAGLALRGLDPFLSPWAKIRGLAFAARARSFLRDRFDSDWWRNPRALQSVRGLWGRGGRPTLRELWADLASQREQEEGAREEPSLEPLLVELAESCS